MSVTSYIFGRKYGNGLLANLVGYYPLNNSFNDFSGNGYNGTQLGSSISFVGGKIGNAVNFGNNADVGYVNIPDNNDFSFTDGVSDVPFTISLWANFSSFSITGNWLINKRGSTSGIDEWQFAYSSSLGLITFTLFDKANNAVNIRCRSLATPALNTWINYIVTYDGSNNLSGLKMYQNGLIQNNNTSTGTYTGCNNNTSITRLGMSSWVADENLKHRGLLDEVAIWKNRELTQDEVTELYNKGNAGLPLI